MAVKYHSTAAIYGPWFQCMAFSWLNRQFLPVENK
jgi:hypothetical protein